jgi:hypothetical protein
MGDATLVPLIGLATVMFAARAGLESTSPEKNARATKANRFGVWPKFEK